ncbi:MAG: rane protein of unknown function [Nitrospira sp.]|jgi:hypothetical protein|nr:rane protein of unknown function [Nitrospira sp.]
MKATRPVISLLIALIAVEAILVMLGSSTSLSSIQHGVLLGFLFAFPALLVGGLVLIRQQWMIMATVMYSTVALALDLATIVQEASQIIPSFLILVLTLTSSLLNFLIMIFGGRCVFSVRPDVRPPRGPHSDLHFTASS